MLTHPVLEERAVEELVDLAGGLVVIAAPHYRWAESGRRREGLVRRRRLSSTVLRHPWLDFKTEQ